MASDVRRNPGPVARVLEAAGHLAVWVGLYFAAAYASAAILLGRAVQLDPLAAAFCAGVGLYLLDRLKLRDELLDPADLAADERRHSYLRARRRLLRALAWVMLGVGTILVSVIHPANAALTPIGVLGVLAYSRPRRSRRRPKDLLVFKNLMPGCAIAGLGVILAAQSPVHTSRLYGTPVGAEAATFAAAVWLALVLLVAADAMLCDLDDVTADRRARTSTLPVWRGANATWRIALFAHALAGVFAVGVGWRHGLALGASVWALTNLGLTTLLRLARPGQVRDLIDLRLPAATLLVYLLEHLA
ncbi:MAG: hypothetical protein ACF8LK_09825 [Phycisphaerales bacterium JB041]